MIQPQNEAQEIEISIEELKLKIALAQHLEELGNNASFKTLIDKGYLEDEAVKLVALTAHPLNEVQQKSVQNKMVGISALKLYLSNVYNEGQAAKAALAEYEQALDVANQGH